MTDDLHYPNLTACQVTMSSSTLGTKPPVKLPHDCTMESLRHIVIPSPYDFALEKAVMAKKKEQDSENQLQKASSREELQKAVVVKMKAVTNADEDVCIALLEDFQYDLKPAVEAFFASS
ncbi:expressed unknown protein [Seminavis robusta]|uniref:Uncharacterized protein n=1 Tax=Seminavis robusta TaxID=568900 RepID=A0A9N8D8Q3_9STRA|nr:expressed unknown protein [Seminavis robusta]|eukprot:Sro37_g023440.1 n/a (120) ;mRNA; r:135077-135436